MDNREYPLLNLFSWGAPIIGILILLVLTISGVWSGAEFSGGLVPGMIGVMLGAVFGFVAGAVLAFPYFIMGELSRALVELVQNTRSASRTQEQILETIKQS